MAPRLLPFPTGARTAGVVPGDEGPGVEGVDICRSFSFPRLLLPEQDVGFENAFKKVSLTDVADDGTLSFSFSFSFCFPFAVEDPALWCCGTPNPNRALAKFELAGRNVTLGL
jgi:hypothetical protein